MSSRGVGKEVNHTDLDIEENWKKFNKIIYDK